MKQTIEVLNRKFLSIEKQGWIKTLRNGASGIGYTFELLIGKTEENFPIPDYNGIEIKTSRRTSWGKIHLFHATPDGDFLFPIKDIIKTLGYPDKDYPEYKVFYAITNTKKYTYIGCNKKIKLMVDRKKGKVYLVAKNKYDKDYNLYISWSFDMLRQRVNLKLKYLAIVKAASKKINGVEYFKYNQIKYYKLKNFDTFIDLIEAGIIDVAFTVGIYKKGKRLGQTHDRGTLFTINEKNIEKLYEKLDLV